MLPAAPMGPSGLGPADTAGSDSQLLRLWLSTKASAHTRRAYAHDVSLFLQFVAKPLLRVTLADFERWASHLGQGNLKPASRNRSITAVKSLLSFAQQTGYLPFNVGAAVKLLPNRDSLTQRILEEDGIARLIEPASGRNRVLLKLLYATGARVSELCGLRWSDVQPRAEGGQLTLFGKGGKTRTVLLKPAMWNLLLSIRRTGAPHDPVFPGRKPGTPLDPSQVRRIVYAAARRAGLDPHVSPHWLRHAHASHALDRHAPIHLVQATLGHASVSTTSRYLHARPTESSGLYLPD